MSVDKRVFTITKRSLSDRLSNVHGIIQVIIHRAEIYDLVLISSNMSSIPSHR